MQKHAQKVIRSNKIAIIGGGAVGVQMATDIKELYPEKHVTLIHSRKTIMNRFHPKLSSIIEQRCQELGIETKLGSRVKLPAHGYPTDGRTFNVELQDGSSVEADFAVSIVHSSFLRQHFFTGIPPLPLSHLKPSIHVTASLHSNHSCHLYRSSQQDKPLKPTSSPHSPLKPSTTGASSA